MSARTVSITRHYVNHGHEAEVVLSLNERVLHVESEDDGSGLYVYVVRDDAFEASVRRPS